MEYSSGVILHRKNNDSVEFFLCTPDGPFWQKRELWNFPKGHLENDETPFEAAIREFGEETSIKLSNDRNKYTYHGGILQNKKKTVFVFSKPYENEDTEHCYSNDTFSVIDGVKVIHKEIKDYKWLNISKIMECGMKCYIPIFKDIINGYYSN